MRFEKLSDTIPYAKGGKEKVLYMRPYPNVVLRLPGRHALQTTPIGGDFVVCVSDKNMKWREHQFTHTDIFTDVAKRTGSGTELMEVYLKIVNGADPKGLADEIPNLTFCINPQTFLYAVQCLAVAEHRRYAQHETKFGGRFLPFRFAAGIAEGLWTSTDAVDKQKMGRPGVEWLEKEKGTPELTKELMG
jgi:hypothetical protein